MSDGQLRVFLADDHKMVVDGLAAMLGGDSRMTVVGRCGNGLDVVAQVRDSRPDVVVLDIEMPGLNGLDVCRELTRKMKGLPVLMLSMHDDEEFIASSLENGAAGYLLKESAGERLAEAIHRVAGGDIYLGPGVPNSVLQRVGRKPDEPHDSLTPRERQVLQLVAEGKTNPEIAKVLSLAVKTVDTHRTRLMNKLDIHNQTDLVKYAIRKGMVHIR